MAELDNEAVGRREGRIERPVVAPFLGVHRDPHGIDPVGIGRADAARHGIGTIRVDGGVVDREGEPGRSGALPLAEARRGDEQD